MTRGILGLFALYLMAWFAVEPASAAVSARPSSAAERLMLRYVNLDRAHDRLPALRLSRQLTNVALGHSLDMAEHSYFSHFAPDGQSPYQRMVRYGLHFHAAGENLGWFSGDSVPAMLRAINLAMMHSPVHRSNLLRPSFHQVGIGVAISGNRVFVTEDFTG